MYQFVFYSKSPSSRFNNSFFSFSAAPNKSIFSSCIRRISFKNKFWRDLWSRFGRKPESAQEDPVTEPGADEDEEDDGREVGVGVPDGPGWEGPGQGSAVEVAIKTSSSCSVVELSDNDCDSVLLRRIPHDPEMTDGTTDGSFPNTVFILSQNGH